VVADSRTHRNGRVIEEIGRYVPTNDPSIIEISSERAQYWLSVGAQPTEQAKVLLTLSGDIANEKGEKVNTIKPQPEKVPFTPDSKKKSVLLPKVEKKAPAEEAPAEKAAPAAEAAPATEEAPAAEAPAAEETPAAEVAVEAPAADAPAEEAPAEEAPAAEAVAEEAPAEEAAAEEPKAE